MNSNEIYEFEGVIEEIGASSSMIARIIIGPCLKILIHPATEANSFKEVATYMCRIRMPHLVEFAPPYGEDISIDAAFNNAIFMINCQFPSSKFVIKNENGSIETLTLNNFKKIN